METVEIFTVDEGKLNAITEAFNEQVDPRATNDLVRAELIGDWRETSPDEHPPWLDTAPAQEIVDWLAAFYN